MKLRNKKTGEIKSIEEIIREAFLSNELDSLKNIDANWEEIEPKEPLIKDEKIRKAVRAWAETNQAKFITCGGSYMAFDNRGLVIEFSKRWTTCMANGNHYTIAELCGEEEE